MDKNSFHNTRNKNKFYLNAYNYLIHSLINECAQNPTVYWHTTIPEQFKIF